MGRRSLPILGPVGRVAVGVIGGGALGLLAGGSWGQVYAEPTELEADSWHVVTPILLAGIHTPDRGRGVYVQGDALLLVPHAFRRNDVVRPVKSDPIGSLSLSLHDDSAPVRLMVRGTTSFTFGPFSAQTGSESFRRTTNAPWNLSFGLQSQLDDGTVTRTLGTITPSTLELAATEGTARIRSLTVRGVDGSTIASVTPEATPAELTRAWGLILGACVGGLAAALAGGGLFAGLLPLALAAWVFWVSTWTTETWLGWVERLYLVRLAPWQLGRIGLIASATPLLVLAFARLVANVRPRPVRATGPWLGAVAVTTGLALWGLSPAVAIPGSLLLGAWLLLPWWTARRAGFDEVRALALDIPSLVLVALGGPFALLPATVLRLTQLGVQSPTLLQRAPRAGADAALILWMSLIPAAEIAVRSTWLAQAWDPGRYDLGVEEPTAYYEQTCEKEGNPSYTLTWFGGSSTGGAYQFAGEPGAFFPGQAHALLCADTALSLRTVNLGNSGRDSFTFATWIAPVLATWQPDVILTWFGVNDLTSDQHITRREAWEQRQQPFARAAAALRGFSRLWSGFSLATRAPNTGLSVAGVPLAHAEQNHRTIAEAAKAAGITVIFMVEHTDPQMARTLDPYAAMVARVAAETGQQSLDLRTTLATVPDALADQNHLTRAGSTALAELLVPELRERLADRGR